MLARGFWILNHFSDAELQGNLKELLRAAGRTEATVVAHLAEVDARRLHLRGAPSLFQYCLVELGFSESEAWYRICAARAGRRFPLVFELLERRELHLTAVALLSKYGALLTMFTMLTTPRFAPGSVAICSTRFAD
jgi:hypothetical protein